MTIEHNPWAVMAIDPSLTGCAVMAHRVGETPDEHWYTSDEASTPRERARRYRSIVDKIVETARTYKPAFVLIEGYSFGSPSKKQSGHHDRAEFRGVMYDRLAPHTPAIIEIAPSSLKKFATGKGNASKTAVICSMARRYDRDFKTDDEADAFALLQIAIAVLDVPAGLPKHQREVVDAIGVLWAAQLNAVAA